MASQGDRFRRRALSRGYKVDEVDAFLDRVEATLAGEPMGTPVPSQEVDDVVFRVRFGGYDEWQVDVYLDRVARQLGELEERGVLGRAPSPEFAGGPPPRDEMSGDGPMPLRGDGPGRDDGLPPREGAPFGRDGRDGPMGGREMSPPRDGFGPPPRGEGPMGPPPRDGFGGPPRDLPPRGDGPMGPPRDLPPRDGPMGGREMSPPRDGFGPPPRGEGPMGPPPRDGFGGPPPRDRDREQAPLRDGSEPTMMIKQPKPHDAPPTEMVRRPEPPRKRDRTPPPPIEDDGESFAHLRADDDEGFGHLRGGDDYDDPFAGHKRKGTPPAGFERRDEEPPAPMGGPGPRNEPDDRFGPPPAPMGGPGPRNEPDDRFGPPPDRRFGPDSDPAGPPPPRGGFDGPGRPPGPPPGAPMEPAGGGMMPPPPPSPGNDWVDATAGPPPGGFGRQAPDRFERGGYEDEMTRPLRRQVEEPEPDSQLTQRLRRGNEDRFAPPPPPMGRGPAREQPPGRPPMMDPPVSPSTPPRGFGPGSPSTPPRGFPPEAPTSSPPRGFPPETSPSTPPRGFGAESPGTPPRGFRNDPDAPTMAHPVVSRPPSPYDEPQGGYREPPTAPIGDPEPRTDFGRRNPYEGRGMFDEPGRHGRDEMTTEMSPSDSPFSPQDLARVEQLRSSFQPRRFGSGYDPMQVSRIFDAMRNNMTSQAPTPVSDKELDTSQFSLVQQGFFEAEVDAALREVRDIFAKRGMVR